MLVPEFNEDVTGLPSESLLSEAKCIESRVSDLESTTTKEFRSIDVRLTVIETMLPHLATKADLHKLETEVRGEIVSMQASLKADMTSMRAALTKWVVATSFTSLAIVVALIVK